MLELKDEEDKDPAMNQDMIRFLDFCCQKQIKISMYDVYDEKQFTLKIGGFADKSLRLQFKFSDLYYPKNLLRTLKEKLSENLECPTA